MIATLPDCALIEALKFKAQQRNDTDFDYLGRLRDLRATVVAEVRSINELFPEYTPHDDAYHHANIDLTSDERFRDLGGSVRVSQKRLNFSYDDVFLPQDRDTAAEILEPREFDVETDLGLQGLQGKVAYATARDPHQIFSRDYTSDGDTSGMNVEPLTSSTEKIVRWRREWNQSHFLYGWGHERARMNARSASASTALMVFKDGILVPNANAGREDVYAGSADVFPAPRVVVNIKGNSEAPELDIARAELRGEEGL